MSAHDERAVIRDWPREQLEERYVEMWHRENRCIERMNKAESAARKALPLACEACDLLDTFARVPNPEAAVVKLRGLIVLLKGVEA